MEEIRSEIRSENLELRRQVKVISQKCPMITKVELIPHNTRLAGKGDEEVDRILA